MNHVNIFLLVGMIPKRGNITKLLYIIILLSADQAAATATTNSQNKMFATF
jgi:hypothetical protein